MGTHHYLLEWLDTLITVTLNPHKTRVDEITSVQVETIISRISLENEMLQAEIKNMVFAMSNQNDVELLVRKYHSALLLLLDSTLDYQEQIKFTTQHTVIQSLYGNIISSIEELLSFMEKRFFHFLGLDERVPATYLALSKKELRKKMDKLITRFKKMEFTPAGLDIAFGKLYDFVREKQLYTVSFRDMLYKKDLVRSLEEMNPSEDITNEFTALDHLLIYLNFNCRSYLNLLINTISKKVHSFDNIEDKIDQLLLHYKAFNQMHRKPGIFFNPQYKDCGTVISNWFVHELYYFEKKFRMALKPQISSNELHQAEQPSHKTTVKVGVNLSTDQTALILRAADELKILQSRSMNTVFKTIVPYLSTPQKENLSYDSMRSKAYAAEDRDKEIAIKTLEKIIRKMREY